MIYKTLISLVLGLFFISCNNESGNSNYTAKPTALGVMNEILIVSDDDLWEGMVGDSLRHYFESAYPILPSPEPFFDLRHFSAVDLANEPIRKQLRTYLIVADLQDADSPTTIMVKKDLGEEKFRSLIEEGKVTAPVGRDKWANGQLVAYLLAPGEDKLARGVQHAFTRLAQKINDHDRKQLDASIYAARSKNIGLSQTVEDRFNLKVDIPSDFVLVKDNPGQNSLWLRKDTEESTVSLVFQRFPYTDADDLTVANIKDKINAFGKAHIESTSEDSYLTVNDVDLPVLDYTYERKGRYIVELRGIWEMTADFYGGPFISFAILDPSQETYTVATGIVLAPGEDKREMIMQLDHILMKNYL